LFIIAISSMSNSSSRRSGRLESSQNYGKQQYQADGVSSGYGSHHHHRPRLPKGWRRYIDDATEIEYYWNEINAESTWTFPTVTAAEWIRSGQGSTIGITTSNIQNHNYNTDNNYQYDNTDASSYNYTTHSARPAVEDYDGQHSSNSREYGTDDENQSVGWNSDRGYYEDEHEFSDPYNNDQRSGEYASTNSSYRDDSSYKYSSNNFSNTSSYGHDNKSNQYNSPTQQQYHSNNDSKASSSKYVLPPRPMTGSYYNSTNNHNHNNVRTLNRYGQRRNSNARFRPSPPPGKKGQNHATHFNNVNNDNNTNKSLPLPPKVKQSSSSAYVIPVYSNNSSSTSNNHNVEHQQLPHLNNNQLDEQQHSHHSEHFKFDNIEHFQHPGRPKNRSLSSLGKELFKDSSKVEIGDYISVLYNERWCIARVLDFKDADIPWVQVEIEGNPNVEEWIDFQSGRLKPFGAEGALSPARRHLKVLSKRFSLADYVEVREKHVKKDSKKKSQWKMAQIVALDVDGSVTVQYEGINGVLGDEKLSQSEQNERMRPLGVNKTPKNSCKKSPPGPLTISEVQFRQKLKENGLVLEKMAPDGNCLFRAVAHQVYGDADKHVDLRNACCDYMLSEGQKEHLENFVDGDFEKYVEKMRKPKTWGGNLEIEAMQEMFDRAIEIHSADSISENTNKTTFKKDFDTSNTPETPRSKANDVNQPIPLKISYHGKSHYNSLVDPKNPPPLLPLESSRFQERRKRRAIAVAKQAEEKKEEERKKKCIGNHGNEKMIVLGENNNVTEQKVEDSNDNTRIVEAKKKGGLFGGFSIFKKSKPKTLHSSNSKSNNDTGGPGKLKPIKRSTSELNVNGSTDKEGISGPESHEKKSGALPSLGKKKVALQTRKLKRVSLSSPSMKMNKFSTLDKFSVTSPMGTSTSNNDEAKELNSPTDSNAKQMEKNGIGDKSVEA